jgi:hypothetical protein
MKVFIFLLLLIPMTLTLRDQAVKNVALKNIGKFSGFNHEGVEFEKTYYISQYLMATPINARSACKSYGSTTMDLASFESREEFQKIKPKLSAEIQRGVHVAVGGFLHMTADKNEYHWISSGLKIDVRYDAARGGDRCLGLENAGAVSYVPLPCNREYLFICQDVELQYSN